MQRCRERESWSGFPVEIEEDRVDPTAATILTQLPMNFPAWRALWGDRAEAVSGSSLGRRRQPPRPPVSRTDAGGFGFSALCMTTGLSRGGDRLDPLTYCVGSGLSWKPSAAAFRFSAFNILAFTLASYSSIDCVTYSWPYLSIR